jgi:hypothetical protein
MSNVIYFMRAVKTEKMTHIMLAALRDNIKNENIFILPTPPPQNSVKALTFTPLLK